MQDRFSPYKTATISMQVTTHNAMLSQIGHKFCTKKCAKNCPNVLALIYTFLLKLHAQELQDISPMLVIHCTAKLSSIWLQTYQGEVW
jgi:hypothetical protein